MKNIIEFTNVSKKYEKFKLGEINLDLPKWPNNRLNR